MWTLQVVKLEIISPSVADAVKKSIELVKAHGQHVQRMVGPNQMQGEEHFEEMLEIHGIQIEITDPRNRWHNAVSNGIVHELLEMLSGQKKGTLHFTWPFQRRWIRGDEYPYNYGSRMFSTEENGFSQWDRCVEILKHDETSRQAVIMIRVPQDLINSYTPCSIAAVFQIAENNTLDFFWQMRSNDSFSSGLGRNLFFECHFLEQMSLETGIPMGHVFHYDTNLHIYTEKLEEVNLVHDTIEAPLIQTPAELLTYKHRSQIADFLQKYYYANWQDDKQLKGVSSYWTALTYFATGLSIDGSVPSLAELEWLKGFKKE